jgi:hypothetical protein
LIANRVDREHPIPGRDQRSDPRAAVGLDPHHHPPGRQHPGLGIHSVVVEVFADHLVQPGHPGHALGQPRPTQPLAVAVEDLDVVVVLGPVVTDEQHLHCLLAGLLHRARQRGADHRDLMVKYSPTCEPNPRFPGQGTSSHQRSDLLTTSGRTI